MRNYIFTFIGVILLSAFFIMQIFCKPHNANAASGDVTNVGGPLQHIVSSSTKAQPAGGERLQIGPSYLYVNVSTAARPHFRRISLGASF
jgi:hypothetical protein